MKLKKVVALSWLLPCWAGPADRLRLQEGQTADGKKSLDVFLYLNDHESEIYKNMIDKFQQEHADTIERSIFRSPPRRVSDHSTGMMTAGLCPMCFMWPRVRQAVCGQRLH